MPNAPFEPLTIQRDPDRYWRWWLNATAEEPDLASLIENLNPANVFTFADGLHELFLEVFQNASPRPDFLTVGGLAEGRTASATFDIDRSYNDSGEPDGIYIVATVTVDGDSPYLPTSVLIVHVESMLAPLPVMVAEPNAEAQLAALIDFAADVANDEQEHRDRILAARKLATT